MLKSPTPQDRHGPSPRIESIINDKGHVSESGQTVQINRDDNDDNNDDASETVELAVSLMEDCKADLSLANLESIIFMLQQALEDPSTITRQLHSNALCYLASALGTRFLYTGEQTHFSELQDLCKKIPETQFANPLHFDNSDANAMVEVAKGSLVDFHKSTSLSTINTVIFLLEQPLATLSSSHARRHLALKTMVYGLCMRFHHTSNSSDLQNAMKILRINAQTYAQLLRQQEFEDTRQQFLAVMVSVAPLDNTHILLDFLRALSTSSYAGQNIQTTGGDEEDTSLFELASHLRNEFNTSGNINDLDEAVALMQEVLIKMSSSSPNYASCLNDLATALATRFNQRGEAQDLDEAILFFKQALELTSPSNPYRSHITNNLGTALSARFKLRGKAQDLDDAILFLREALKLTTPHHPARPGSLINLGSALVTRFEQRGQAQDLDEAISFFKQALELTRPAHPNRSDILNNLGSALFCQFRLRGSAQDLNEAVSFHRQALDLRPPSRPNRPSSLSNLANALTIRFEQQGEAQDMDEAILLHKQALNLTPPYHPYRSDCLNNLGSALFIRFIQRREVQDLDEAVSFHRQALRLRPPPHPNRISSLSNLANVLAARADQNGEARDLDEAISFHKQVLALTSPHHPNRSKALNDLANALGIDFEHRGVAKSLDEAILLHRQALELVPHGHPDHFLCLNNLANALKIRFEEGGKARDLNESMLLQNQALELFSFSQATSFPILMNLGVLHVSTHKLMGTDSPHLEQAMSFFSKAIHSVSHFFSRQFLSGSTTWAQYADLYQHPSAIEAYDAGLDALPQLAALSLDLQSRQNALSSGTDGLARKAASCAIRVGRLDKAVEYLETGRGVFWSQFLHLRSPLDQVRDIAPELEKDLHRISKALERGAYRDIPTPGLDDRLRLTLEEDTQRYQQLAREWSQTLDKVRNLKGFEDFLQPQKLSTLQTAAERGPVVYLVANNNASDCLILTSTTVHHIPFPKLPALILLQLVKLTRFAVSRHQVSRSFVEESLEKKDNSPQIVMDAIKRCTDRNEERGMRLESGVADLLSSDDIFKIVLGVLWSEAVKPIVKFLGLKKSNQPVRLTWCATGLFSFLPIHAAGYYDERQVDCASDYIISSYTPTIGALLTPDAITSTETFKMMAIVQSRSLPCTRQELKRIEQYVPAESLISFGVPAAPASVDAVAAHLSVASIVHFACHGKQDPEKPLNSGLEIEDEQLTISRIMKEAVPNGSLAFLSACETAMGDKNIPDEALSIGASLLFSGFRSVVATMWKMWDEDGPIVADAFYRELFRGPDEHALPRPDTRKSALALSVAVKELRSQRVPFKRWVPFIHMGK